MLSSTINEARLVKAAFERRAGQQLELCVRERESPMAHMNHLMQNTRVMVHESPEILREAPVKEGVPEVAIPPAIDLSYLAPATVERRLTLGSYRVHRNGLYQTSTPMETNHLTYDSEEEFLRW